VPNAREVVNVATVADADALEAKAAILERPSLYSYDSLFYQIAVSSFADYRKRNPVCRKQRCTGIVITVDAVLMIVPEIPVIEVLV
jgi:hypothetical protein